MEGDLETLRITVRGGLGVAHYVVQSKSFIAQLSAALDVIGVGESVTLWVVRVDEDVNEATNLIPAQLTCRNQSVGDRKQR